MNRIIFSMLVLFSLPACYNADSKNSAAIEQRATAPQRTGSPVQQYFLDGSTRVPHYDVQVLQHDCIFCNIIRGTEPAKIIAENNEVLIFESIRPMYPSHWLIIPKKHIHDLKAISDKDVLLMGKLLSAAGTLANQLQKPQACNIALNEGKEAGQTVFHIHLHFYSESELSTRKPTL